MKIAHVVESLDPANGGPPVVASRLAAAQARLGHEVSLISYRQPGAEDQIRGMMKGVPGGELVRRDELPPAGRLDRVIGRAARREMRSRLTGMEVVHLHGVWDPILRAAADTARAAGIPYVVAPHGMLDPWSLSQRRLKKRIALLLGYRTMLNQAAFLHLLNRDEADLIRPLGLTARGVVIPNGIDPQEVAELPPGGSFTASHPVLQERPFILFLSRLHHKKGLDFLAQAFARVAAQDHNVQLVVAGPDGGARAAFEAEIRSAGLVDRVYLVGPLYGKEKYAALRDAACFCLPSRQEGFSVAILEALACGTPVVISDACHFPEVAERGAGVVVPLDADAISQAILRILSDETLRQRMGEAGRATVLAEFTWPVIAEQSISEYEKLSDSRKAAI
jgi:glycosyltransferase involved in cell wall biosynthesis